MKDIQKVREFEEIINIFELKNKKKRRRRRLNEYHYKEKNTV